MVGEGEARFGAVGEHLRERARQAVRSTMGAERTPQSTLELASAAVQLHELAAQLALQSEHPEKSPIACKQGCAWCCHQMVITTPPLALCMVQGLEGGLSPADRTVIVERIRNVHEVVRGKTAQERRALRVACPLLNGDATCIAHAARPLACRGWNSYDADACREAIDAPMSKPAARVFVPQFRLAQAIEDGLREGLDGIGMQAGPIELVGALRVGFEDREAHMRWLAGARVFDDTLPADRDAAEPWIAASAP